MIVINFQTYRDGGTVEITTDKGIFCFDERKNSSTKGRLYLGYPNKDKSNIINNSNDLEQEIVEALKNYSNDFYKNVITYFIESKTIKKCEFTGKLYKLVSKKCNCECHSNPGTLHMMACCDSGRIYSREFI